MCDAHIRKHADWNSRLQIWATGKNYEQTGTCEMKIWETSDMWTLDIYSNK